MSSKEVKNALKAAREAIRNKEYKEALKQCKAALAEDKNNYNALVFVGVAAEGLEQYDQALKAYNRATEVSPDQLLAWQGLSTMHSKHPGQVPKEDMVKVYEKLIELYENDQDKQQDAVRKLIALTDKSCIDKALSLYEKLQAGGGGVTDRSILSHLVSLLQSQPQLSPQHEAQLLSCLQELLSTMGSSEEEESAGPHVQCYLQLLQKREPERVFEECSKLAMRFSTLAFPLETKLQLLLDRQMDEMKADEVGEIRNTKSSLSQLKGGQRSGVLLLAEGYLALLDSKLTAARDCLQECVIQMKTSFCGYYFLAQVLFRLHSSAACIQVCQEALSLLSSKSRKVSVSTHTAAQQLRLMAVRCCLLQCSKTSLTQAFGFLEELTTKNEEADILHAYICLGLGDEEQLESCMAKLQKSQTTQVTALRAWVDFHKQDYSQAASKLQQCVKEDNANADYLLKLGRALWEQRQGNTALQEQCFNTLLKAAKLDPYLSGAFLYLGHFYTQLKKDQQRGKKCYQKAYDLDPNNEEAGAALCDMMAALGEEESVQNLLLKVTETASAGSAKWAWLRLGLAQVRTEDPSAAAASFQSALRADPSDRHVWECLAEAYLHRGSFNAALKAFEKAVELHPDSTYSLYQIATIKQKTGKLSEAADEYKVIVNKSPNYVPALKGLGETYLMITQRHLAQGLLGLAVDTCQQALTCLTRAATHRPDLSCLWKLMGDGCTVLHSLHSPSFTIEVPRRLMQATSTESTESVQISKLELLQLGTRCYGRALKILPDSASLWHDLGLGLFYLCKEMSGEAEKRETVDKSVHALKKAVCLDPSNHMHWTALGVVAASQYVGNLALAQHSFIKSVQCETNNAVAWTNLGTLYLRSENIQLAHEAFKVAQSQDPEYVGCWVGQALVAETVGHEEAMDLFRHTTALGIHLESCSGYGHWVVTTLLDVTRQDTESFQYCIHQMAAIPAAADALTRYTGVMKEDAGAFNMLGLLQEHQDLCVSALQSFRRAADLARKSGASQDIQNQIQLNMARLLSKNKQYAEAAQVYESCGTTQFADLCLLGLALYKAGRLRDSYQVYQQAVSVAHTDKDRSGVCAALGMVAFKAGNRDDAKTALFQGFQLSTPSLQGLLALCALGLLQGDLTLTQATLQELSGLVKGGDKLCDVAMLTAALKVQQGESSAALTSVQELLTDNSDVRGLYLLLSRLALRSGSGYTAQSSAKLAVGQGTNNNKEALLCLALSQLYVGHHSQQQAGDNAFRTAQKTFHCRPDDMSTLCCLVAAIHGEAVIQCITKGSASLFSRELGLLDLALTCSKVTKGQRVWCLQQKALVEILMGDSGACGHTLQQLSSEEPGERDWVAVMQCILAANQSGLEPLVIRDGSPLFFWQILLCSLMKDKRWMEADVLLKEALQKARGHSEDMVKVVCLVSVAWLAAQQLLGESGGGDGSGALAELEEAAQAVEQLSEQPYTLIQVLQALVHLDDNPRKAKHHFANALEPGHMTSCLGTEISLARRGVISFLHSSGKDQDLMQKLLSEAEAGGDHATVEFYEQLQKS